jgi:methionyl aminopeptidase
MNNSTQEAFEKTRIAGSVAAGALDEVAALIKPGITTSQIDDLCYEYINDNEAYSAPLFYRGFPKSCCTSTNHVVCHGIPKDKILYEGDIVNVDVTAFKNGWHGDTSRMFFVGDVSIKAKNLVQTTYNSMLKGIETLSTKATLGDIGFAIQSYVENKGFSVVRDFCGHGIGESFHKQPNILHYGKKGMGQILKEGMIFTIEPMINEGVPETKILNDGWTAVTKDKKLSAQFEHTVGITKDGYEIFTLSKKELNFPPYKYD